MLAVALVGVGLPASVGAQPARPPAASVPAVPPPGPLPQSFDQLRVATLGDQLIRYLAQVVQWAEQPEARAPAAALGLTIAAAVDRHPEARIAAEQRTGAAYGVREAQAGWLPQVQAGVEGGRRSNDRVSTPWANVPSYDDNSKAVSLSARQLVWDFGAVNHQIDSRTAAGLSVQARAQAKRSELTLRALSAWMELFRARQLVAASRMNVLSREQITGFVQEREQLGASATSDVLRARARLADAQAAAVAARNQLTAAEAVYAEIFDQAAPAGIALPEVPPLDAARAADLARLIDASPLVADARRQAEAAQAEARAAQAAVLPSISLDVSVRRRDLGGAGTPGTDWNAGLAVRQNVFNGGADQARAAQAGQRAREAQLNETNLRQQLGRALEQARASVMNGDAAVAARKEAAQVAAVALEAVREQFAFRRGSLLDLLRAQEELHQATRDLIDALTDQTLQRYRFLHLAADLAPMFGVAVDAPAPAVAPMRWLPGGR